MDHARHLSNVKNVKNPDMNQEILTGSASGIFISWLMKYNLPYIRMNIPYIYINDKGRLVTDWIKVETRTKFQDMYV